MVHHVVDEECTRDPLSDRSTLKVGEGDDDRVDLARLDLMGQGFQRQHSSTLAQADRAVQPVFEPDRALEAIPWPSHRHRLLAARDGANGVGYCPVMSQARPRPLVGVSMYRQMTSWWSWERDAALVPGTYLDVLEAAGGQAVLIPPVGRQMPEPCGGGSQGGGPGIDSLVEALDGLVLIGGGDVEAGRYGQEADSRNGGSSSRRDALELALLDVALRRDLPVLAVCRGMQILNVHLGGDLIQQLPDVIGSHDHQPQPGAFGPMEVVTEAGSAVRRLLGDRTEVLCSHHQAIATPGRGLVVTAKSGDGVIEAVELAGHRFVLGVQWHPEEAGDLRLFEALVDAARSGPPSEPPAPPSSPDRPRRRDGPRRTGI